MENLMVHDNTANQVQKTLKAVLKEFGITGWPKKIVRTKKKKSLKAGLLPTFN